MTRFCQLATKSILPIALLLTFASSTFAQPGTAQSFEQLQVLVSVGNAVKVIDSEGNRVTGRIAAISDARLILNVKGTKRTLEERNVVEIRRRGGDSLANGAWWGFGVGAGIGTLGLALWCGSERCSGSEVVIIPVYGALGAGVGVAIDALIRGERAVYRAPVRRLAMSVTPLFGKRTGIGVSVSF